MFSIILAIDSNGGIAKQNKIPWTIPDETRHFRITTEHGIVIMGRKTWESLPEQYKPLPKRRNIVITSQQIENVETYYTLNEVIDLLSNSNKNIFVIGGVSLYQTAILHPQCQQVILSVINQSYDCDLFLPSIPIYFSKTQTIVYEQFQIEFYSRVHEEQQYLNILQSTLRSTLRSNRTGIDTYSQFGSSLRFSLMNQFPLLTTKRVFWKGVVEELLFFLRGETDAKLLNEKGVKIWNGNSSHQQLQKLNLDYREGDIGPMYGWQWRHWGSDYTGCDENYNEKGIDQIQKCLQLIKSDPDSRRMIVSAWNVSDLEKGCLNPCHCMFQFYVTPSKPKNMLSCSMYQRSCDTFLGLPFNIASYALLTYIMAELCDLIPGELIINIGDTHIYSNHLEQVKKQLTRQPYPFPQLKINKPETAEYNNPEWDTWNLNNFELIEYQSHPGIKAEMAV